MEIRRDSFLYRVAYFYKNKESPQPIVTNLCLFFWRFILAFPVALVVFSAIYVVVTLLYVVAFLFGRYLEDGGGEIIFCSYRKWPKIGDYRILPIGVLSVLLAGFGIFWLVTAIINFYREIGNFLLSNFVLLSAGIIVFLALAIWGIVKLKQTELGKMIAVYLVAKKQKVCPIIQFVDSSKEEETGS
ncbi:MAG: hypothetical protein A3I24_00200 [Candidatus Harrisonbacteria bacterium RIFCSPLOWO2_02_FULL_41_13b]|uniref:Uncharacterized protein n=1 Tax=Candidatus Harrisonbacteria bacterium RIFCSPLOWO2_02_FULL_41_13b TaxID=1798409 RepID=A0A1G1ZSQ1_9BACT|nr:MAG: hypothetical protein A3J53_00900 [Candidatus Harrisonbacteria bacterium RIFCSPHIGHO2_02_FULL_40_20]OGY67505.1 MAG: hypothetical protein A3I24_00200 [Candidatus Harrisonbacteria bacterium RIFCSPLOWO2_02_FULL_41_13b]